MLLSDITGLSVYSYQIGASTGKLGKPLPLLLSPTLYNS